MFALRLYIDGPPLSITSSTEFRTEVSTIISQAYTSVSLLLLRQLVVGSLLAAFGIPAALILMARFLGANQETVRVSPS
jgi:hypothetical protein